MLPKPVTAFALSALISIASFTASTAVAAPASSSDSTSSTASSAVKGSHHAKKKAKASKKSALPPLHSAEPKESPKLASREPSKVPASLSTHLDLKNVKDKSHATSTKKPTIAATGKEVFIGGPTGHGKSEPSSSKASGKLALGSSHGSKGPMSKSGRTPARPESGASKTDTADSATDDHPVDVANVSLRGPAHVGAKVVRPAAAPCMHDPIEFVRGAETERFAVTSCAGAPAPLATERLSVLVRPDNAAHPASIEALAKVDGAELAPGIRRIDSGLLSRLQTIADHFAKPGLPERISIVSGYRPGSSGSFHASGQALDFHLEGVANEALVDFCKTLENTGCGYYPNSSFVHVDVRAPGTGHVAWIDTSGPGEPPHYVSSWPPPPEADVKLATKEDDMENPYKPSLPPLPEDSGGKLELRAPTVSTSVPLKLKDWE